MGAAIISPLPTTMEPEEKHHQEVGAGGLYFLPCDKTVSATFA